MTQTSNMLQKPVLDNKQKKTTTGFNNIDNQLFGGMTSGSLAIVTALPGTCKSTLYTHVGATSVQKGLKAYYFSGEETLEMINARFLRLGISEFKPYIYLNKDIREIGQIVRSEPPDILFIDSLQSSIGSQSHRLSNDDQISSIIQIRKLTDTYRLITWVSIHVRKDKIFAGPQALIHYCDVFFEAKRGINDEVILTTPTKNRFGSTNNRSIFRMTEKGLIEKDEQETGYILRHQKPSMIGLAVYVVSTFYGLTTDEITVTNNEKEVLLLVGGSQVQAAFLSSVIQKCFNGFQPAYIIRSSLSEKILKAADLAIVMAVLSKFYEKPLPRDTAFIASIDAFGKLLPIPEMSLMVQRAKDQGYSRVFGAVPIGSQVAAWETANTIVDVWRQLGF